MEEISPKIDIQPLASEVSILIEQSKSKITQAINSALTTLYWQVGNHIRKDLLKEERAAYGKQVVGLLSKHLTRNYGNGWSEKQLRHCMLFAEIFPRSTQIITPKNLAKAKHRFHVPCHALTQSVTRCVKA
jgi:hypothetical protein